MSVTGSGAAIDAATRPSIGPIRRDPSSAGLPIEAQPRAAPLRANFGWTLAGNVVYAGCQWVMLVAIARLASPDAVGTFALGTAITAPLFLLAGLNVRAALVTDAARRFRFADYLGVRACAMGLATLATAVIVWSAAYDTGTCFVVLAVAASKAIEGVSDLYYGALQQGERMRPIAVSLVCRGALGLAALAVVLWLGGGLLPAVLALSLSWAVVLVLHDRPAAGARRVPGAQKWPHAATAREIVWSCWPLGAVMMLVSLHANVPRYFIERRAGAAELGVFAALSSLLVAGNLVIGALGQAAIPRLARYFHEGNVRAFRRLLGALLLVAALLGASGLATVALAGRPILRVLFGAAYAARTDVLLVLMASAVVSYAASAMGYALTAARRFKVQLPLFAATALACAAACAGLVPVYGLMGAAAAWGLSLVAELVALALLLQRALLRRAAATQP